MNWIHEDYIIKIELKQLFYLYYLLWNPNKVNVLKYCIYFYYTLLKKNKNKNKINKK